MDNAALYQESRPLVQEQMARAVLAAILIGVLALLVGFPFTFDYPWLYSCWFGLVTLTLGALLLVRFWRLWIAPVYLLTGRVRQRRFVTHRPFSLYHPTSQHILHLEPLAATQIGAGGATTAVSIDILPTDYRVPTAVYEQVREGDEIELLCLQLVKQGIRLVNHSANATPPAEGGRPPAAPLTASAAVPSRPKSLAALHQDYRAYRRQRLVLTLAIGGGLSYLALMGVLGSLMGQEWLAAGCLAFWAGVCLLITAFFLWRVYQAPTARLTAVVLGRKEELRHSRGAVLWRNYYLRLRPLQAMTYPLSADGQLTAAPAAISLPHDAQEVEYSAPYDLFQSAAENETVELLYLPRYRRVIGRIE